MRVEARGYEGVQQRVAEIQARMAQVLGTKGAQAAFSMEGLDGAPSGPTSMSGSIGAAGNGFAPLDPMAMGASLVPEGGEPGVRDLVKRVALESGLQPNLLDALVSVESGYNPGSVSPAGAKGLCQLMDRTAAALGVQNPFDAEQNLRGGAKYLSQLIRRFGNVELALAAYNAGPNAVIKAGGIPSNGETPAYVRRVLERAGKVG